jgi:hypothetical protein
MVPCVSGLPSAKAPVEPCDVEATAAGVSDAGYRHIHVPTAANGRGRLFALTIAGILVGAFGEPGSNLPMSRAAVGGPLYPASCQSYKSEDLGFYDGQSGRPVDLDQ